MHGTLWFAQYFVSFDGYLKNVVNFHVVVAARW
jgi:hypothetical protein